MNGLIKIWELDAMHLSYFVQVKVVSTQPALQETVMEAKELMI